MGIEHTSRPIWGVQFHPESIATEHGRAIAENFYALAEPPPRQRPSPGRRRRTAGRRADDVQVGRTLRARRTGGRRRDAAAAAGRSRGRRRPSTLYERLFAERRELLLARQRRRADLARPVLLPGDQRRRASAACSSYDVDAGEVAIERAGREHRRAQARSSTCSTASWRRARGRAAAGRRPRPGRRLRRLPRLRAEGRLRLAQRAQLRPARRAADARQPRRRRRPRRRPHLRLRGRPRGRRRGRRAGSRGDGGAGRGGDRRRRRRRRRSPEPEDPAATSASSAAAAASAYLADIAARQAELAAGESYEVCLTDQISTDASPDPFALYRHLRRSNPAPFAAFLASASARSSAPRRSASSRSTASARSRRARSRGRSPAHEDPVEDAARRAELADDEKTRAEHLMIVDLLRNDLGRVCDVDSVSVPDLMVVEPYATVHQVVSTIQGTSKRAASPVECVRACFPGGSMTGAPKERTMEIIDELEDEARGVYSGAIGYFGARRQHRPQHRHPHDRDAAGADHDRRRRRDRDAVRPGRGVRRDPAEGAGADGGDRPGRDRPRRRRRLERRAGADRS